MIYANLANLILSRIRFRDWIQPHSTDLMDIPQPG
jgi:hypothetical protein